MGRDEVLPRVVYVAGYGRSGSTILDMLLGMQPRWLGGGELAHAFVAWQRNTECSCGKTYARCLFWSEVQQALHFALPGLSYDRALRITRRVESGPNACRLLLGRKLSSSRHYAKIWQALFGAMSTVGNVRTVVDSSKSTRLTAGRALALSELCDLDINVIHLVRDPRAVMWSALRGSNRKLEAGQPAHIRGSVYRTMASWLLANLGVHAVRMANSTACVLVRYEDLVTKPTDELERVAREFGLDLSGLIDRVEAGDPLPPGHGIAGNRLRRRGIQHLQLDEEWKSGLPWHARILALLGWPLASRYGYQMRDEAERQMLS